MGTILFILILFSVIWLSAWFWFFHKENASPAKMNKRIDNAFESGDYKKAKENLLKTPNLNSNTDALFKLGTSHFKLGEYEDAKKCFEQILKLTPKDINTLLNLAQLLEQQGNYEEAIEIYNKILSQNDKDILAYLRIGNIYSKQGKYESALEILEKAKQISPENIQIECSITRNKIELCDSESDEYKQLIDEYANFEGKEDLPNDFKFNLAKFYAKDGNIEGALEYCQKAIEESEHDVEAYQLQGLIKLISRDIAGAKNSLSIALNLQPSNTETHNIFSYLFCNQTDYCEKEKCRKKYYKLIEKYLK